MLLSLCAEPDPKRLKTIEDTLHIMLSRFGQPGIPSSTSKLGVDAEDSLGCRDKEGTSVPGQPAVFSEDEVKAAAAFGRGDEKKFDLFLMPILARSIKPLVVVNSEDIPWLPSSLKKKHAQKPDLFLLPGPLYKAREPCAASQNAVIELSKHQPETAWRFGLPADPRFFRSVVVVETKLPDNQARMPTASNFGEALKYSACLRLDPLLQKDVFGQEPALVILVTPSVFWLIKVGPGGFVVSRERWKWEMPGSLAALQAFRPSDPWVDVESLCLSLGVKPVDPHYDSSVDSAFLGAGGSGRVFRVISSLGVPVQENNFQAVNVVCTNQQHAELLTEWTILKDHADACGCDLIAKPNSQVFTTGELAGFAMTPVGQPVTPTLLLQSGFPSVSDVFVYLQKLHTHPPHGYCHGDARLANVILVGSSLVWINLKIVIKEHGGDRRVALDFKRNVRSLVDSLLSGLALTTGVLKEVERCIDLYNATPESAKAISTRVASAMIGKCEQSHVSSFFAPPPPLLLILILLVLHFILVILLVPLGLFFSTPAHCHTCSLLKHKPRSSRAGPPPQQRILLRVSD